VTDEITLTLPRQRPFVRIAHLVLGGLAVRLDLTFENLEDLQIALAGLLDRPDGDGFVTLSVRVDDGTFHASVGPFDDTLRAELEREPDEGVGLRRVLETVVDDVDLGTREGGVWVELTKSVQAVPH
jgi:anti-sigma regulatory factor (Ser/Thr protein kinase)